MWKYFRVCFRASLNRRRRRRARHPFLTPHSPALAPPPRPGRSLVARVGPWALVARVGRWVFVARVGPWALVARVGPWTLVARVGL